MRITVHQIQAPAILLDWVIKVKNESLKKFVFFDFIMLYNCIQFEGTMY